jgi:hypothetical protein
MARQPDDDPVTTSAMAPSRVIVRSGRASVPDASLTARPTRRSPTSSPISLIDLA